MVNFLFAIDAFCIKMVGWLVVSLRNTISFVHLVVRLWKELWHGLIEAVVTEASEAEVRLAMA